jgi:hypothetical protein
MSSVMPSVVPSIVPTVLPLVCSPFVVRLLPYTSACGRGEASQGLDDALRLAQGENQNPEW